jgi:iron complex outermembrane recepter protein
VVAAHKHGAEGIVMRNARLTSCLYALPACLAGFPFVTSDSEAEETGQLKEVIVTARKVQEDLQTVPVAVTALSREEIERYEVSSLEKTAAMIPGLIVTRGNSGSGADISLRGIGSNFSSIGIEQSVAVVVDGVYYGQGRVIDEGFTDLSQIELLKGPQALFFGKNSTAGVISFTSADPGPEFEAKARVGYEIGSRAPKGEAVISGPVTDDIRLRLAIRGEDMLGGYVRNDAPAGSYTTIDSATFASTSHYVPAPANRDLPADRSILGRATAIYEPSAALDVTLKATIDHHITGGTSWNDKLWKCPSGSSAFPGATEACGTGFQIEQNPVPPDIAATVPYMGRYGGELYTLYDSHGFTARIDGTVPGIVLSSVANYQHFEYSANSDYDFTAVPIIWASQQTGYSAVSEEARARTQWQLPVNFMLGGYYQRSRLSYLQPVVFYGSENTLAPPSDRYVSLLKDSATTDETFAGFGQVIWTFLPGWELTAGARYTAETKSSFFAQPYVNPFFSMVYIPNTVFTADQRFHNTSPEVTLTFRPDADWTLYAAFKTGYKSGGFSNSASISFNSGGVNDLTFRPETVRGVDGGVKATLLDRTLRLSLDAYHYDFSALQVDFFNAGNLALITTNAGSAVTEGVEAAAEYLPAVASGLKIRSSVAYNLARYRQYSGPCYGGQTQAQGCDLVGPAPDHTALQDLSGKPTADSPKWTGLLGADYHQRAYAGLTFDLSADLRYSSRYAVSPFAEPLAVQPSYVNLDAALQLGTADGHWQLAVIGKNLTNNFVVTYALEEPSTGTPPGRQTGTLADQTALFDPPRTVELQLAYHY